MKGFEIRQTVYHGASPFGHHEFCLMKIEEKNKNFGSFTKVKYYENSEAFNQTIQKFCNKKFKLFLITEEGPEFDYRDIPF